MAKKLYEESSIQDIASAIRAKNGSSDTYTVAQMSTAIADIPTGGGGSSRIIDMNNVDASVQGSMKYVGCLDSVSTLYSTGDAIGCSIHCTDAIDVTNADKIVFRLKTGRCYGHDNANVEQQTTERFKVLVGIVSSWTGITYLVDAASLLLASKKFDYTNTVYTSTDCYLDVSSITGDVYIGIDAHGWNATLEEIRLE